MNKRFKKILALLIVVTTFLAISSTASAEIISSSYPIGVGRRLYVDGSKLNSSQPAKVYTEEQLSYMEVERNGDYYLTEIRFQNAKEIKNGMKLIKVVPAEDYHGDGIDQPGDVLTSLRILNGIGEPLCGSNHLMIAQFNGKSYNDTSSEINVSITDNSSISDCVDFISTSTYKVNGNEYFDVLFTFPNHAVLAGFDVHLGSIKGEVKSIFYGFDDKDFHTSVIAKFEVPRNTISNKSVYDFSINGVFIDKLMVKRTIFNEQHKEFFIDTKNLSYSTPAAKFTDEQLGINTSRITNTICFANATDISVGKKLFEIHDHDTNVNYINYNTFPNDVPTINVVNKYGQPLGGAKNPIVIVEQAGSGKNYKSRYCMVYVSDNALFYGNTFVDKTAYAKKDADGKYYVDVDFEIYENHVLPGYEVILGSYYDGQLINSEYHGTLLDPYSENSEDDYYTAGTVRFYINKSDIGKSLKISFNNTQAGTVQIK